MANAILCLDIATTTGWAVSRGMLHPPISGSIKFDGDLAQFAVDFEQWLSAIILRYDVAEVIVEAPIAARGMTTLATLLKLYGANVIARKLCRQRGVVFDSVNVTTWRMHFLGCSRAPMSVPKSKRTGWLKLAAVEECSKRSWLVTTHDEADALGLLAYVLHVRKSKQGEAEPWQDATTAPRSPLNNATTSLRRKAA